MKNIAFLITYLLSTLTLHGALPFNPDELTQEQAAMFVDMIVNTVDKEVASQIKSKTGQSVNISLENKVMFYNFTIPDFTSKGLSPELTRFFIAANRPEGNQIEGIKMWAKVLDKAGYKIGYRYMGIDTMQAEMDPQEFLHLTCDPMDTMGFDYSELLTQLIANFNSYADSPDIQREFSEYETSVDGAYIAIRGTTRVPVPMLSDANLDAKTRAGIAHSLVKGPYAFAVNGLIKAARQLRMQGIKYDISDPEGNQRIITLSWDDINTLAEGASDPDDPESQLDMADQFLTDDIAKLNLNITFSHITDPPLLRLIIAYDYPAEQFNAIIENTGEDALMSTYAPFLCKLLPKMPEIQTIIFELTNTDGERITHPYPRSKFTSQ